MKIIINADDFGIRPGVDKAIMSLFGRGLISSASLLVNHSNSREALEFTRNNPEFGVGLHLDLDRVFTDAGFGTAADGSFLVSRLFFDNDELLSQIKNEIKKQFAIFFEASGQRPDHVDGHHHVHLFLPVLRILLEVMDHYDIRALRFDRKFYQVTSDSVIAEDLLRQYGISFTDKFIAGPEVPEPNGARSVEIMVHVSDDVPEEECWRIREKQTIESGDFQSRIAAGHYELINYRRLRAAALESCYEKQSI